MLRKLRLCEVFLALILLQLCFPANVFGTCMFRLLSRPIAVVLFVPSMILVISQFKKVSLTISTPDASPCLSKAKHLNQHILEDIK